MILDVCGMFNSKSINQNIFFSGSRDWEWWDDSVPGKLKSLDKDGYRVIFFTNQAGIEKLKVTIDEITIKIENIIKELGIPVYVSIDEFV